MPASTFSIRASILADVGLGREVGIEQGDMLVGQRLGEAAVGQALDEAVGIERDGLRHGGIIGAAKAPDKHQSSKTDASVVMAGPPHGSSTRPRHESSALFATC